jgi:hypothetical protein
MAQRDERGMTTVHASPYSDQNASTDSAVWTSPRTWAFGKLRSRTAELIVEAGCAVHGVDLGVRTRLPGGGGWIRTSGTADDAWLLVDLYAHNASRPIPQKGSSDQTVACLRRLGAGLMGSAVACAFRFRPPGTGNKRAGWRRSGAVLLAFFGAASVCFEPDASRARLRFKAAMRSITGGGAALVKGALRAR